MSDHLAILIVPFSEPCLHLRQWINTTWNCSLDILMKGWAIGSEGVGQTSPVSLPGHTNAYPRIWLFSQWPYHIYLVCNFVCRQNKWLSVLYSSWPVTNLFYLLKSCFKNINEKFRMDSTVSRAETKGQHNLEERGGTGQVQAKIVFSLRFAHLPKCKHNFLPSI